MASLSWWFALTACVLQADANSTQAYCGPRGVNTTADDVASGLNLTGRVAIVTGGDGGLGYPAALALARQGATVVIASRNLTKIERAAAKIAELTGGDVRAIVLDLGSFASVRSFVERFLRELGQLNILINNAGMAGNPQTKTVDGYEMLFQVNYLGPFLLTELLLPALRLSSPSHVVNVASSEHEIACQAAGWPIDCLSDWTYLPPPVVAAKNVTIHYSDGSEVRPVEIYGFTKFLLIQHAAELARREMMSNVQAFSLTPGWVNTSLTHGIALNSSVAKRKCAAQEANPCPFTAEEGAAVLVFCALRASHNGRYYSRIRGCQDQTVANQHGFTEEMGAALYLRSLEWSSPTSHFRGAASLLI